MIFYGILQRGRNCYDTHDNYELTQGPFFATLEEAKDWCKDSDYLEPIDLELPEGYELVKKK